MQDKSGSNALPHVSNERGRRPRIALMGEFSAGKSTLANMMIGADPLPMQVIATQLPPVWISHGKHPPTRVELDGAEEPCDPERLAECPLETTAYIKLSCEEELLKLCDLIDMPGISDPNMSSDVWERVLPHCDGVIWCSHATQAWRQSEAAVWDTVPEALRANSILLLTRSDMLLNERDRERVLKRVQNETSDLFDKCLMISLLEAREAEDDQELWKASGADAFVRHFLGILQRLTQSLETPVEGAPFEILEEQRRADVDQRSDPTRPRVTPRRPNLQRQMRQSNNPGEQEHTRTTRTLTR